MRKICCILWAAALLLCLTACTGESGAPVAAAPEETAPEETAPEETAPEETAPVEIDPDDLLSQLIAKVDISQDPYLATEPEDEARGDLSVRSVHFGSYTESGADELLALFLVNGTPHAAGEERTIAAVFRKDGLELAAQMTIEGDTVSTSLFKDTKGRSHLLVLASGTYQGLTRYGISLWSVRDGAWAEETIDPRIDSAEEALCYGVTEPFLIHVFALDDMWDFPRIVPRYELLYTLKWDREAGAFVEAARE